MKREEAKRLSLSSENRRLYISPLAPIPLVCFFFIAGGRQLLPAILAVVLHELGHLVMIRLCGAEIEKVMIYPFGGEIVTKQELLSYRESLMISFAGIAVNLISAAAIVFARDSVFLIRFCIYSLMLALFNLLPLKQLDGGSMLVTIVTTLTDPFRAEKICNVIFISTGILFALFSISGIPFYGYNPTLILLTFYFLFELF